MTKSSFRSKRSSKILAINSILPSSFRDPSGFVYRDEEQIYRQVNQAYREQYDCFIESGLYSSLVEAGRLVKHDEINGQELAQTESVYKVIQPEVVPFISYPYEWSFSQLKEAAVLTLAVQQQALAHGMWLKDASAYNVQFVHGQPVFIDTLSFEKYIEGTPWVAYRQFCQHFLCPLALMSYVDIRFGQLLKVYIDGIPIDLASRSLPAKTWIKWSLLAHVHLHASAQQKHADDSATVNKGSLSKQRLSALVESLKSSISKLHWKATGTEWRDYYDHTNYSQRSAEHKATIIEEYLERENPQTLWDLGANTGSYSRIASRKGIAVISFDVDPGAVDANYVECRRSEDSNLLPLLLDLTNPSPAIGWNNSERMTLIERGPADMVFALALIHHLAISNNVPFSMIADFFSRICRTLVIEFVPKTDSQVQRLLATRTDIFDQYNRESFESVFSEYFRIEHSVAIRDSDRVMYLMRKSA